MNVKLLICALAIAALAPATVAQAPMPGMDMGGARAGKPATASAQAAFTVTATVQPNPPHAGSNLLSLTATDGSGKPATGLILTTSVAMASMDMGTSHPAFKELGGGRYQATITFSMAGPWRVTLQEQGRKIGVLDFSADGKSPWKTAPITVAAGPHMVLAAPTASKASTPAPMSSMAGMTMDTPSARTAGSLPKPEAVPNGMAGMSGMKPDSGMTGGSMDMKTATVSVLQEKGTYTATGDENWKAQTGFGHNAGMVGMMNQMMVGSSGMEGMKMPVMKMDFGPENYTKTDAGNDASYMAGMNMATLAPGEGQIPKTPVSSASGSLLTIVAAITAPKAGDNPLTITVTDAQGKPVTGAKITTSVAMTSMDMGTSHPSVKEQGGGKYVATATFSMAGPWRVMVKASAPGQPAATKAFDFTAR